jgi:ribonuclease HII
MDLSKEKELFANGFRLVAGIDEVGRGPLAGPVVAACVVCTPDFVIDGQLQLLKDSKKLTAKRREELYEAIMESPLEVGIGACDHKTVDRINILQASFLAMKKALGALRQKPEFILLDGRFPIPNISYRQEAIINGDNLVYVIAAASVVAKVTRDRIMQEAHQQYPVYGFNQHKGYGTRLHLERLHQYGPCPIHRQSFKPVQKLKQK